MAVEIQVNGTRAVVSEGIWQSADPALQQMLTAVCATQLLSAGYVPDTDLACARIAQEHLRAEVVSEKLSDDEAYPPDAGVLMGVFKAEVRGL